MKQGMREGESYSYNINVSSKIEELDSTQAT